MPPSAAKSDADKYDDRMLQVLRGINVGFPVDVRELVVQTRSLPASHMARENRTTVEELQSSYAIDDAIAEPAPASIGIVDDVLVAGAHYRAMRSALKQRFPDTSIVGFFIARRIFPPTLPGAL